MKFDHDKFLTACGNFNDSQKEGMDFLLSSFEAEISLTDIRWLAYMLATIGRECAGKWQPISEYGKGQGHSYGQPDPETGQTYYGRGYVQLTWKSNYQAMGKILGIDLVSQPDMALDPATAYHIMSHGMQNGSFTGVGLKKYIHDDTCDYVNARRIINGTDHAQEIADAAVWFQETLKECTV